MMWKQGLEDLETEEAEELGADLSVYVCVIGF